MKKKIIIGSLIVVLVAVLAAVNIIRSSDSTAVFGGGKALSIRTVEIRKGEISSYISANGNVEEIEKAEIHFDTPLKVEKLPVSVNQKVSKGQTLVELDMDSIEMELEKLRLNKRIQEISMSSNTLESEVTRAANAVKSAENAYKDSLSAYVKNKELFEANAISRSELEAAEKALSAAEIALNNARVSYESAVSGRNTNRKTAEENLKAIELSISDLEAKVEKIKKSTLSPIDGYLSEVNLTEGAYTSSMQPAFIIVNLDRLQVKANVREYDIKDVKVGQTARITGDSLDKDRDIKGRITSIAPVAKINRTSSGEEVIIETIVSIDDGQSGIKPGISVTCDIYTNEKKDVLIAPMQVIDEDKDGNKFVFVVRDGVMHKKTVKTGISSDMNVEILEGLSEGDTVVLEPQPVYKDGVKVKIINEGTMK
jgi:HlyD family secretion protein